MVYIRHCLKLKKTALKKLVNNQEILVKKIILLDIYLLEIVISLTLIFTYARTQKECFYDFPSKIYLVVKIPLNY